MTAVTRAVQGARQDTTPTQDDRELRKAAHGTAVHEACRTYGHPGHLTGQEIEALSHLPILVQQAVAEYRRLMETAPELQGLKITAYEVGVRGYIGNRYLTGSIDQAGRRYGERTIVELKTEQVTNSTGAIKRSITAQVNAYRYMAQRMWGIKVHMLIIELQPGHKGRVFIASTMSGAELEHRIDTNTDETKTW